MLLISGIMARCQKCEQRMMAENGLKKERILGIFYRLMQGERVDVKSLSQEYGVSYKSISRDIGEIRIFLADNRDIVKNMELKYSRDLKTYRIDNHNRLSPKELLLIIKILTGVRAVDKVELLDLFHKMKNFTERDDRNILEYICAKEMYHYQGVSHFCTNFTDLIWKITHCIFRQNEITIVYSKMDGSQIERRVRPLSIMFSEFYFYLIAVSCDDEGSPHYYRIDRISRMVKHRENFQLTYSNRFDEGELRKKIQYMFPGESQKITFEFTGPSVQAVLDRLQTAKIIAKEGKKYLIEAEIYGDGIKMFLLSQGHWVRVLKPERYVEEITREIKMMYRNYGKGGDL